VLATSVARLTRAQPEEAKSPPAAVAAKVDLAADQKRVKEDFRTVEQLIIRLAESYSKTDPKKAQILRQTFAASKERRVDGKFEDLVGLLAKDELFKATKSQAEVHQDLLKLLELLQSGDHDKELADQQRRLREYIARVNRIIKYEEEQRAQTQGDRDAKELVPREDANAGRTDQLAKDIERTEGKSGGAGDGKNESGKSESGKNDAAKSESGKNESGDGKSGDSKSDDAKSGDGKSGDAKSGKNESGKNESGKKESGKSESGDSKSDDSKSGDSKSDDSKSGDSKSGKSESGKSESGKKESGKSESGDSKSDDSKSGDSKRGDSKSGDSKSGKSESGKSESGKSESGKSESGKSESGKSKTGDSKSGDSKSGNSKSGDSKSGDSESGDSESGDSKSGDSKSGNSKSGDSKSGDSESGDSESESQPMRPEEQWPDDAPAKKRLRAAEERMRQAKIKLERANRKEAAEEQQKAIDELIAAKKELEEILRQLREEEVERMLAQLESRFRKMLDMQVQVHAGTLRVDRIPESARTTDDEIEALRLSRKEKQIADECEKAIVLLKEEGSAVALPEAAEQAREDMIQVMHRLERANVGTITQGTQLEIIQALEEIVAALQQAQRDQASGGGGGGGGGGGDEDQPLVDKIAELKMIRALQMRVNLRTQRFHKLLKDPVLEQADKPDLIEALKQLSEREERVHTITRDIVVGKTE
jgi:hypothetical protein